MTFSGVRPQYVVELIFYLDFLDVSFENSFFLFLKIFRKIANIVKLWQGILFINN